MKYFKLKLSHKRIAANPLTDQEWNFKFFLAASEQLPQVGELPKGSFYPLFLYTNDNGTLVISGVESDKFAYSHEPISNAMIAEVIVALEMYNRWVLGEVIVAEITDENGVKETSEFYSDSTYDIAVGANFSEELSEGLRLHAVETAYLHFGTEVTFAVTDLPTTYYLSEVKGTWARFCENFI